MTHKKNSGIRIKCHKINQKPKNVGNGCDCTNLKQTENTNQGKVQKVHQLHRAAP